MQGGAVAVEGARPAQAPGLDHQRVGMAMAVVAFPAADRIAREGRRERGRPIAAVGIDAAQLAHRLAEHQIGGVGCDDELHAEPIIDHHARHAGRDAAGHRIVALAAVGLGGRGLLQHRLIVGGERGALAQAGRLARIEAAGAGADPLALPVGQPRGVLRPRSLLRLRSLLRQGRNRRQAEREQHDHCDGKMRFFVLGFHAAMRASPASTWCWPRSSPEPAAKSAAPSGRTPAPRWPTWRANSCRSWRAAP